MPRSRNLHRRTFRVTVVLVAAVLSTMVYGTIMELLQDREHYLDEATALMREQSYALGDHVTKNLEAAGVTTGAAAALMARRAGDNQAGSAPIDLHGLEDQVGAFRLIRSIAIFDGTGAPRYSIGDKTNGRSNVADRPFFQLHKEHGAASFIDKPSIDPATGRWSVALSRRIAGPAGEFLGVVQAVVEPLDSYRLHGLLWGDNAFVAVIDGDGQILTSWPETGTDGVLLTGRPVQSTTPFGALAPDALGGDGQRLVDGDNRLVVVNRLPGVPLAIVIAQSHDDTLADWREEVVHNGVPPAVAALLAIVLLMVSRRYAKRHERAAAALEQSRGEAEFDRAQLEALYDTAPVGLALVDRELRYVRMNRKMAEMTGSQPDRDIGRKIREIVPDIAEKIEPIYRKVLQSGKPLLNVEVSGTTPAQPGVTRHWLCGYHPIFGADGRTAAVNAVIQEVTELKRMDELRSRLVAVLEASPDFVGFSDADRRPTFINRAGRRMLGIGDDEDISGLRVLEFYDEGSRKKFFDEVRPSTATAGTWQGEMTMVSRDGRPIPVQQTSIAHRYGHGEADFFATFVRDISRLKQAEEWLERREEHFRALIENASDLISVIDTKGTITFHSPSSQMLGYRPEELVGRNYEAFVHPDDLNSCRKAIAELATDIGGVASVEFRMRQKDGGWRILHAFGRNAMHRRAIKGIVINARDVTAIRQAEATHARLAAALDGASEGFALFDRDDRLVYVNPEFCRVSRVADILGPGVRYEDIMRTALERGYIGAAIGNEAAWLRDHMLQHRTSTGPRESLRPTDGTWLRVRSKKLADNSTFVAYTDITAEKMHAEELRQAQKLEVVGKLTAGVAHDFNNLLTAVIGNLEIMSETLSPDSKLSPFVRTAMTAAERGAKLVQQLLAFSRKQPLDPLPQDLGVVIGGLADLLHTTVGSRVVLDISTDRNLWLCKVDAHQLEHALLNLATNARDAMPDGGRFAITGTNLRATVPFAALQGEVAAGDYVVIAAADTGTGMPADVVARAIEPFFTTKDVGKGSGLGLSMVCGFAKQSGGDIAIESTPGHGTRIELYLPRADAAAVAVDGTEESAAA